MRLGLGLRTMYNKIKFSTSLIIFVTITVSVLIAEVITIISIK